MGETTATITIRGHERRVGERYFTGPDFYATLVDGDDDMLIVIDEFDPEQRELLFVWVDKVIHTEVHPQGKRGCWELVS